jgi:hypothetical protein
MKMLDIAMILRYNCGITDFFMKYASNYIMPMSPCYKH